MDTLRMPAASVQQAAEVNVSSKKSFSGTIFVYSFFFSTIYSTNSSFVTRLSSLIFTSISDSPEEMDI